MFRTMFLPEAAVNFQAVFQVIDRISYKRYKQLYGLYAGTVKKNIVQDLCIKRLKYQYVTEYLEYYVA